MLLQDTTAVVTGAQSGIGLAIAERFSAEGARVICADIAVTASGLTETGKRRWSAHVDVASEQSVEELFDSISAEFGGANCLVNCAGIGRDIPLLETTADVFDEVIAINLRGTFLMARAAARAMVGRGSGSIINISSVSGLIANRGRVAYGASKAGVIMMSQVMAVELGGSGVRVNVIAPGPIETPLVAQMHGPEIRRQWLSANPMGRYGTTGEVAGAAVYLAGPDSTFVNGQVLTVDGGFAIGGILPDTSGD